MLGWRLMADGEIEEIEIAVHGAVILPDGYIPSLLRFLEDVANVDDDQELTFNEK